ncbi:hypothetical protein [Candidatus Absconditicoccus praedator]|uniref:hypothetical protein n=1 Tax=Candidatus Absconditicoccus praedator TaxID=2735562 RepID=UPI001E5C27D4|nr:hypothetical protein [Candidatus Absconditicoccus praedator]UFX83225.1 hypothetical protein HLG78_03795 [Candidatus Absconditicoccus praedator]
MNIIKFYNIQNAQELESLFEKDNVINVLKFFFETNLEGVLELCEDTDDFEQFVEDDNIISFLQKFNNDILNTSRVNKLFKTHENEKSKYKNLDMVLGLCSNIQDLELIFGKKNILKILSEAEVDVFEFVIKLCDNIEEFIDIGEDLYLYGLLKDEPSGRFKKFINKFNIQNSEGLKNFLEAENSARMLRDFNHYKMDILIGMCCTLDDLKSFYEDENTIKVIDTIKELNISSLEYLMYFFKIECKDDLLAFFQNEKTIQVLKFVKRKNLENIVKLYNIQKQEELEKLFEKENLANLVKFAETYSLIYMTKHISSTEEFEWLCESEALREVTKYSGEKDLFYLVYIYNIQNAIDFREFCENNDIRNFLKKSKYNNLYNVLKYYGIKTQNDVEKVFGKENITNVLYSAKKENLDYLLQFCDNLDELNEIGGCNHVVSILKCLTPEHFRLLLGLCATIKDIEKLCQNENLKLFLENYHSQSKINLNQENISKQKIVSFLDKRLLRSKQNIRLFFDAYIPDSENLEKLLIYCLENKQKSLLKILQLLRDKEYFGVGPNIDNFKTLDDFRDENQEIKQSKLRENFEKIVRLNQLKDKLVQKKLREFDNLLANGNIKGLEKLLMENLIEYFINTYYRKRKIKIASNIKKELGEHISIGDIDIEKIDRQEFKESYKMALSTQINKKQINKLLIDYFKGKFDNLEDGKLNQYDTKRNKKWLRKHLNKKQQKIWLSRNTKIINVLGDEDNQAENIESRIDHHFEVAIRKINEINSLGFDFEVEFDSSGNLVNYFNSEIKKSKKQIKEASSEEDLFDDLELQIREIEELFKGKKSKEANKIIIERELDPLNSLMMGNRVEGSCLSFNRGLGNYYSVISNTIDVNKAVFYVKDENYNILGRCLVTIGNDNKISRYKMYYNGNVSASIDNYFDKYIKELSEKLGLQLNGSSRRVKKIECDKWYDDGIKVVKEN